VRLDKILYVGLPNEDDRADIMFALTKGGTKPKLASDVDLAKIACSRATKASPERTWRPSCEKRPSRR
jgi:SpoVK/Ycf46/Vps4 family AAA+-type ATPase